MKLKKKILAALLGAAMLLCSCSESRPDTNDSAPSPLFTDIPTASEPDTSSWYSPDSSKSDSEPAGVPMWEGTAPNGNKIVFLGSMHAAKDDFYPMPEKIAKPFNEAEVVAFECDTDGQASIEMQFQMQKDMLLTDGSTLSDHISPEAYKIFAEQVEALGSSAELYDSYKPWAAYEMLSALFIRTSDVKAANGIDYYLLDKTKTDGKKLMELEHPKVQLDMVTELPDETYDVLLRISEGETKESFNENYETLYNTWLAGDLDGMEQMTVISDADALKEFGLTDEEITLIENRDKIQLDDRNIGMAKGIKELFNSGKKTFVCVGCAHYLGEKGIIALLEKEGYSFKRI